MSMRIPGGSLAGAFLGLAVLGGLAGTARADKLGGFSGVDRHYLVNQDRVCKPLEVQGGAAAGAPSCEQAAADVVARLSIKAPLVQAGPKATFAATASGRTISVTRKASGTPVVTWSALDPVGRIVEVYANQYEDRVAVAYTTRRAGTEVTNVIAFDLGQGAAIRPDAPPPGPDPSGPPAAPSAPPSDPKLTAAVTAARKATGAKALAAWKAVLALDDAHAEARYRIAAAQAAKQPAEALASLAALAASGRADAIEWQIEARYDAAFATLRGDAKFRAAVLLDRAGRPASAYEKLMGFGGQWEQSGTACDRAEVHLTAQRDRSFKLRVKTACQGSTFEMPFKGTWRLEGGGVVLAFPNKGKATTAADESRCSFEVVGDEDALKCSIGRDLEFSVLPVRR